MNLKEIERFDKKLCSLINKKGYFLQNPKICKLINIDGIDYYMACQVDKLDEKLWEEWCKFIEDLKDNIALSEESVLSKVKK